MAEAQYVTAGDGSLADLKGIVDSCIDALARLGHDDAETLREIQETRGPLDKIAEFAAKSVFTGVTGFDRMSLAYAEGPQDGDSDA